MDLIEQEHVCSTASKRGRYRQEVTVEPESTRSVPFVIIPIKEGEHGTEVKAAVKDSSFQDGIRKIIQVVGRQTVSIFGGISFTISWGKGQQQLCQLVLIDLQLQGNTSSPCLD